MIEIRTILDYRDFLEKMTSHHRLDNFMLNFIRAFSNIRVGCSCKKKARIAATNKRKEESIMNMSQSFIQAIKDSHQDVKVAFYQDDQIVLTVENE